MNENKRKNLRFPPHESDSGIAFINGVIRADIVDESMNGCCLAINNPDNIHLQENGKYVLKVNKIKVQAQLKWIKLEQNAIKIGFHFLK